MFWVPNSLNTISNVSGFINAFNTQTRLSI
jgi:hypothetical protein